MKLPAWLLAATYLCGVPAWSAPALADQERAIAARCGKPVADARHWSELAADAVDLFARGGIAIAAACRAPFVAAAGDTALPAEARWAALHAYARLSSTDADQDTAVRVAELAQQLGVPPAAEATARLARIELGVLLVLSGQPQAARAILEPASRELAAADASPAARSRADLYLAWAYNDTGNPARGRELVGRVLLQRQADLGDTHAETLMARLSVAAMAYEAGDFAAAQDQYTWAEAPLAATLGPRHAYTLRARRGIALSAMARGRFDEATQAGETALRDASEGRPGSDPEVLALRVALAQLRLESGDPARARDEFAAVIPVLVGRYGEDDDRTLEARDGLSTACEWLGDARCALRESQRMLEVYAAGAAPADLRRLGAEAKYASALLITGRFDEGTRRLERALAAGLPVHGARNRWISAILQELAYAYLHDGRPQDAIAPLQQVIDSYAGDPGELPHPRLHAERMLAAAWLTTGHPRQALELLDASIERRRAVFGADHPVTRAPLVERSRARLALGDAAGALADADAVLADLTASSGSLWRDRFSARATRAQALEALGRQADAVAERRTLVHDVEGIRGTLDDSPAVRQAYLREWVPLYKQLAFDEAAGGRATEAFRAAELARARTLLEGLRSRRADEAGPADARDREALAALAGRIGVIDEVLHSAGDEARVALEVERTRVAQELAALRARIAARDPRYAALLAVPEAVPADAPRVLAPGDLFVSYTVHEGRLLVIALDAEGRLDAGVVAMAGSLRDAIEGWRALLLAVPGRAPSTPVWIDGSRVVLGVLRPSPQARRAASADEVGTVLAGWLLEPLRDTLPRVRRLVIAPDPALALLPFDALPWNGRPLVASVDVAHVQSFGVLSLLASREKATTRNAPRSALVVADPAYGNVGAVPRRSGDVEAALRLETIGSRTGAGVAWPRLPGTRREAQAVGALFPQRRVLLDAAASETALKRAAAAGRLRHYDVLHFATHGLISARQPWSSALVLAAPRAGSAEDGYLTALEMSRMALTSRLVVLSACDTATGNALEGEGVLGFPYVLLASGATSTMLTLWPIDDNATASLMPEVMKHVRAGLDPSRALALAKRAWIAGKGAGDVRAWAGVMVYGR